MSAQGDSAPVGPDMRGFTSERVGVVILDPDHLALLPGPPRGDCRLTFSRKSGYGGTEVVRSHHLLRYFVLLYAANSSGPHPVHRHGLLRARPYLLLRGPLWLKVCVCGPVVARALPFPTLLGTRCRPGLGVVNALRS